MQSVEANCNMSSLRAITCGIPQGSILGSLLFVIYMNDIVHESSVMKIILFADDTNLLLNSTNLNDLIATANTEIQKISDQLKINKLSLNIKKTHFILFHFRQKKITLDFELKIDNSEVEKATFTKFLGVVLQENLSWKKEINLL